MYINVLGAGLAGCEAAWQIASRGIRVRLFEMKPHKMTPAHKSTDFCELICSNSLKAARVESAAGLLKEEMRRIGSLLMQCADKCSVPAGGALAVDRERFSAMVTEYIRNEPLIEVIDKEVTEIPDDSVTAESRCTFLMLRRLSLQLKASTWNARLLRQDMIRAAMMHISTAR